MLIKFNSPQIVREHSRTGYSLFLSLAVFGLFLAPSRSFSRRKDHLVRTNIAKARRREYN